MSTILIVVLIVIALASLAFVVSPRVRRHRDARRRVEARALRAESERLLRFGQAQHAEARRVQAQLRRETAER